MAGIVVDGLGMHRLDQRNVVDDFRGVRQKFADPCAGLSMLANLKIEDATGNVFCPDVMPVMRWPMRTDAGRSTP